MLIFNQLFNFSDGMKLRNSVSVSNMQCQLYRGVGNVDKISLKAIRNHENVVQEVENEIVQKAFLTLSLAISLSLIGS